jgi:hypothetical protein
LGIPASTASGTSQAHANQGECEDGGPWGLSHARVRFVGEASGVAENELDDSTVGVAGVRIDIDVIDADSTSCADERAARWFYGSAINGLFISAL